MKGYRINQAQINRIRMAGCEKINNILDSLELLDTPYSIVMTQPDGREWPRAVTFKDVDEGKYQPK